ncbi:MAG TPA: glucoamylase family protein [Planctomycetota bacterium]|nr:glucoamylase family protein [Planctomycetota bacterium]
MPGLRQPVLARGLPFLLGILLAGGASRDLFAQAVPSKPRQDARLLIEDFDRPRPHLTRLESELYLVSGNRLRADYSHLVRYGPTGYSLHVTFDQRAEALPKDEAGLRFSLSGSLGDARQVRNLTPYSELSFQARGGETPVSCRLRIELRGDASAYWEEEIPPGRDWVRHRIPLDPSRWSPIRAGETLRFDRIKEVDFRLAPAGNPAQGDLYLDGLECLGRERSVFDWKAASDEELIDYVEYHTYQFFEGFADPTTGFTLDRTSSTETSSIAAIGFGLAAHAVAASRGWITPEQGADRVLRILRSLQQGAPRSSKNGFFAHYLRARTGDPDPNSEISIIDTALLLAGVYVARGYFGKDPEIASLSAQLIEAVQWGWFFDAKQKRFYMAWSPTRRPGYEFPDLQGPGFFCGGTDRPIHWGTYTDEVALISILAAASPRQKVAATSFASVDRTARQYGDVTLANSYNGSLFTYFFGSCFLDTRRLGPSADAFNWYDNSTRAIAANRRFAQEQKLPDWAFGITACEGPDGHYHNYGTPPSTVKPDFDGTVALYGMVGSILHSRPEVLRALRSLSALDVFQEGLGFADALNLQQVDPRSLLPWVNWTRFGIDQGAILLILENARTGFASTQFQSNGVIDGVLTSMFPQRTR